MNKRKTKWNYIPYEIMFAQNISSKDADFFKNEIGVIIRNSKTGKKIQTMPKR